MKGKEEKFKEYILKNKKTIVFVSVILIVFIMFWDKFLPEEKNTEVQTETIQTNFFEEECKNGIKNIVKAVSGDKNACVEISFDSKYEIIYEKVVSYDGNSKKEEYVILSGKNGEETVISSEKYPTVRGVVAVFKGGDDAVMKMKVIEAISAYTGISSSKICVSSSYN